MLCILTLQVKDQTFAKKCSDLSFLSRVSYSLNQPRQNVRQCGRSQRLFECPENLERATGIVARRTR